MSIDCLNKALKIEGLTPTKKLILVILANYADENNSCFPSYQHIGQIAGIKDPKHIGKIVKEFAMMGLLEITPRYKEDGGNISNRYTLKLGTGHHTPKGVQTTTPHVSTPPNTKDNTKEIDTAFEEFWKVYPRKVSKSESLKRYKSAIKEVSKEVLLDKVKEFAQKHKRENTDQKFIPHCSTWLNQKRYLDEEEKVEMKKSLNNLAG